MNQASRSADAHTALPPGQPFVTFQAHARRQLTFSAPNTLNTCWFLVSGQRAGDVRGDFRWEGQEEAFGSWKRTLGQVWLGDFKRRRREDGWCCWFFSRSSSSHFFVGSNTQFCLLVQPADRDQQLDCALDLMRRLPPQQIEKNLSDLIDLVCPTVPFLIRGAFRVTHDGGMEFCWQVPDLCEDLLSSVDQPLKVAKDKSTGRDYLLCDYNRDGDSYRWDMWRWTFEVLS